MKWAAQPPVRPPIINLFAKTSTKAESETLERDKILKQILEKIAQ